MSNVSSLSPFYLTCTLGVIYFCEETEWEETDSLFEHRGCRERERERDWGNTRKRREKKQESIFLPVHRFNKRGSGVDSGFFFPFFTSRSLIIFPKSEAEKRVERKCMNVSSILLNKFSLFHPFFFPSSSTNKEGKKFFLHPRTLHFLSFSFLSPPFSCSLLALSFGLSFTFLFLVLSISERESRGWGGGSAKEWSEETKE